MCYGLLVISYWLWVIGHWLLRKGLCVKAFPDVLPETMKRLEYPGFEFQLSRIIWGFEFRIQNSLKIYLGGSNFELRIRARFICRLFGFRINFERNYDRCKLCNRCNRPGVSWQGRSYLQCSGYLPRVHLVHLSGLYNRNNGLPWPRCFHWGRIIT